MEHSTSPRFVHDGEMEQGFGAGPAASTADLAVAIHHDQLLRLHPALVHATGRHQQQQGLPLEHAAEIAPGAITPPPLMNGSHRLAEFLPEPAFFAFARPRSMGSLGGLGAVGLASWPPTVFIPGEPGGGVAILRGHGGHGGSVRTGQSSVPGRGSPGISQARRRGAEPP